MASQPPDQESNPSPSKQEAGVLTIWPEHMVNTQCTSDNWIRA